MVPGPHPAPVGPQQTQLRQRKEVLLVDGIPLFYFHRSQTPVAIPGNQAKSMERAPVSKEIPVRLKALDWALGSCAPRQRPHCFSWLCPQVGSLPWHCSLWISYALVIKHRAESVLCPAEDHGTFTSSPMGTEKIVWGQMQSLFYNTVCCRKRLGIIKLWVLIINMLSKRDHKNPCKKGRENGCK